MITMIITYTDTHDISYMDLTSLRLQDEIYISLSFRR